MTALPPPRPARSAPAGRDRTHKGSHRDFREGTQEPHVVRRDLLASLVVFLVALPLCVGVAVASGVPAELGLVTGIVGGLVVGLLPGSKLQVSGPAAGLTVLVFEAVKEFGLSTLGPIVLAAGLLQVVLGLARFGRWFRAISVSVVQGMLAGIGLIIVLGQVYAMADLEQPGSGLAKLAGLPGLAADIVTNQEALTAFGLGAGTVAVLLLWPKLPARVRIVPAPLAAVALATAVASLAGLRPAVADVNGLLNAIDLPGGRSSPGSPMWRSSAPSWPSPSSPRPRACSARRPSTGCTTAPVPTTTRSWWPRVSATPSAGRSAPSR